MGTERFAVRAGVRDAVIAGCVTVLLLAADLSGARAGTRLELLGHALLLTGGLALYARRRAPVAVLAVTGLCAVGHQAAGVDVPVVAFLFAVYAAVREGHRLSTVVASVAVMAALPLAYLVSPGGDSVRAAFTHSRGALELGWLVAAGAAGEALRQAERRADEAERTREETARRRADEERLRIARELHDSLTHQISIVKLQAEVAVHVALRRGERPPEPLLAIQEAGREASRELRATLEALRDDDTRPPHTLDDIPELVKRSCTGGLETRLTVEGAPRDVPAAVQRTAYRVVQEALTNVARHAAARTAEVTVEHREGSLTLCVEDDGGARPGSAPLPGIGLLGMNERVTALGGTLRAGPRAEGGFRVLAELPVERTP
ncbi:MULTISPECIES: sensor histidine kinase [unclassified Streptomyces]|uniref:sensor histidine kinase n=1 Tax=unclassified Streptomyces TaxID=2593676 RepID=UPI00278BE14F|nr:MULTISPECIES: histidine kinase [unclassified Streptomyces]